MINDVCIFEDSHYNHLHPLTLSRPLWDLRCGISSLKEKILRQFPQASIYLFCRNYLAEIVREQNPNVKVNQIDKEACLFINGRILADSNLPQMLQTPKERIYLHNTQVVAAFLRGANLKKISATFHLPSRQAFVVALHHQEFGDIEQVNIEVKLINYPWDLINNNAAAIEADFKYLNQGGQIQGIVSEKAVLLNEKNIYVGEGSVIKPGAVLDAENGPIYVGKNVTIMSNAVVEGPAFIGDNSIIKIGAKIYEGTSIGEVCKVGGEVEESIIHSYSNKQHEGFLGHAYLGQWVNIGADTNTSDLKNNYSSVKVFVNGSWVDSGSLFVGLFMGDHSKTGINTMFNTGTVVGVMSNVFGAGYPPKFVPSFTWGGSEGFGEHELEKALETARRVMARRNFEMSDAYEKLFRHIFQMTQSERNQSLREAGHKV